MILLIVALSIRNMIHQMLKNLMLMLARCSWGDIGIRICVAHLTMLPSTKNNKSLNCSGGVLRYLKNCSRSSFNSWNSFKCSRNKTSLEDRSHPKIVFRFSFLCLCFFNFKSSKHNFSFKNSSSVHNCFEIFLNLFYLTCRRTLTMFPIKMYVK